MLITVQRNGIADIDHLEYLGLAHILLIDAIAIGLIGTEIIDQIFCGYISLIVFQFINRTQTIYVGDKTEPFCVCFCDIDIIIIAVQDDAKIVDHGVSIRLYHLDDRGYDLVQFVIFIVSAVFKGYRVGQFIIGKEVSVAVINISAGSFRFFRFLDLKLIILGVIFAPDNLEIEKALYQYR